MQQSNGMEGASCLFLSKAASTDSTTIMVGQFNANNANIREYSRITRIFANANNANIREYSRITRIFAADANNANSANNENSANIRDANMRIMNFKLFANIRE